MLSFAKVFADMTALNAQKIQAMKAGTLTKNFRTCVNVSQLNRGAGLAAATHQELRIVVLEDARRFRGCGLLVGAPGHHADALIVVNLHHLVDVLEVQELNALLHELDAPATAGGQACSADNTDQALTG